MKKVQGLSSIYPQFFEVDTLNNKVIERKNLQTVLVEDDNWYTYDEYVYSIEEYLTVLNNTRADMDYLSMMVGVEL